jgi:hypothetical protein
MNKIQSQRDVTKNALFRYVCSIATAGSTTLNKTRFSPKQTADQPTATETNRLQVDLHLSGLTGTDSHPDMQKIRVIGFFL